MPKPLGGKYAEASEQPGSGIFESASALMNLCNHLRAKDDLEAIELLRTFLEADAQANIQNIDNAFNPYRL